MGITRTNVAFQIKCISVFCARVAMYLKKRFDIDYKLSIRKYLLIGIRLKESVPIFYE